MPRFSLVASLAFAALLSGMVAPALALPVVVDADTFCCSETAGHGLYTGAGIPNIEQLAQTFTIVNDGALVGLEFLLQPSSPYPTSVTAYIVPVLSGVPAVDLSLSLASATVLFDGLSNIAAPRLFSGFSLSVLSGDELAVVLAVDPIAGLMPTNGVGVAEYSDLPGSFFARTNGDLGVPPMTWSPSRDGIDLMFRTYVDCASESNCVAATTPVLAQTPEPTGLMLVGLGALIFFRRHLTRKLTP